MIINNLKCSLGFHKSIYISELGVIFERCLNCGTERLLVHIDGKKLQKLNPDFSKVPPEFYIYQYDKKIKKYDIKDIIVT